MEFVQNMEACRKELQQLLLPSSWGSALLTALEQGSGVLGVLSLWLTSFLWVQHSCSRSTMSPGVVKPLHWCCQCRFCTELQSTRGAFPAIINVFFQFHVQTCTCS